MAAINAHAAPRLTSVGVLTLVLHGHTAPAPSHATRAAAPRDNGSNFRLSKEDRAPDLGLPRHLLASYRWEEMSERDVHQSALSGLVGCWSATLLHRSFPGQSFQSLAGTSDDRWVLGGRFVEMALRAGSSGDAWSAVFYVGYERNERRHVLVSLEPGGRRVTTRLGEWRLDQGRLLLMSPQARAVCDMTVPGQLKLELIEDAVSGQFVRFRADYCAAAAPLSVKPAPLREHRRFVIA